MVLALAEQSVYWHIFQIKLCYCAYIKPVPINCDSLSDFNIVFQREKLNLL